MHIFVITFACGVLNLPSVGGRAVRQVAYALRKLSTLIYLVHMFFIQKGINEAGITTLWGEDAFFFITARYVVCASIILSVVLLVISYIKPFRWIRKIM